MTASKQKKLRIAWISITVAAALLLSGAAIYILRGEWIYYLSQAFRRDDPPDLQVVRDGEWEGWSLHALKGDPRVRENDLLMLVNASHPLPADFEAELTEYNGARMNPAMVENYIALRDRVQSRTGVRIYVAADYRSAEEQASIYANAESGVAAPVGCSEHEAGLSLDVYAPRCAGINFLRSPAGRMVNRICGEHGFVIRYPEGKESITGISFEPWHLRYVGDAHARIMSDSGLVLEEYLEYLTPDTWFASGDYRILRISCSAESLKMPVGWSSCEISPDNTGYMILTVKMSTT